MRQVFFSFEYNKDAWRASQIRNMNVVSKSSTFSDNDWETVKSKSDASIKKWINERGYAFMHCGSNWQNHFNKKMGEI